MWKLGAKPATTPTTDAVATPAAAHPVPPPTAPAPAAAAPPAAAPSLPPVQAAPAPMPTAAPVAAAGAPPAPASRPRGRPRADGQPAGSVPPGATPAPRRSRGAAAAAAPAPAPAPAPAQPAQQMIVAPPAGGALATLDPNSYLGQLVLASASPDSSAMGRFLAALGNGGGEPNIIPTVLMTDSGLFDVDAMNPEGSDVDLPTGKDAFNAVFLGYRFVIVAWPHMSKAAGLGTKDQPLWRAVVGSANPDAFEVASLACADYQFTQRERRPGLYDSICHPRGALELLWWEPQAGFMATRTQQMSTAMKVTMENLIAALPKVKDLSGQDVPKLAPFPAVVAPGEAVANTSKGGAAWEEFPIGIWQQATGDTLAAFEAFKAWLVSPDNTPEVDAVLKEWNKTTLSDNELADLQAVSRAKRGG